MRKKILLTALLVSANDYDYLRGMRETSEGAFQRWWRYRCDHVVFDDAVAQTGRAPTAWQRA